MRAILVASLRKGDDEGIHLQLSLKIVGFGAHLWLPIECEEAKSESLLERRQIDCQNLKGSVLLERLLKVCVVCLWEIVLEGA
jgi:hypothetical protein